MLQQTLAEVAQTSAELDQAVKDLKGYLNVLTERKVALLAAEAAVNKDNPGKNADARKAWVTDETRLELRDYLDAENDVTWCKERIRFLHARLSALQTVARAEQTQFMAEPLGQYT